MVARPCFLSRVGCFDGRRHTLEHYSFLGFQNKPEFYFTCGSIVSIGYNSESIERLSSASSRPLTSALVDVPTPDQQFYRESLVAWERSCDQILVHQPFARRAVHEAVEPQQRVATLPSLSRKVNSSTYRPRCFGLT